MLCYVMLCYVMLCYVMLCYVMLCIIMYYIIANSTQWLSHLKIMGEGNYFITRCIGVYVYEGNEVMRLKSVL